MSKEKKMWEVLNLITINKNQPKQEEESQPFNPIWNEDVNAIFGDREKDRQKNKENKK